jgi:hypothetical protein
MKQTISEVNEGLKKVLDSIPRNHINHSYVSKVWKSNDGKMVRIYINRTNGRNNVPRGYIQFNQDETIERKFSLSYESDILVNDFLDLLN